MKMYLKTSLNDRINFDRDAFCWADECIRAAEVNVRELDIEEFAHEHFKLEREHIERLVDDVEEARLRFLDAFRKAHRYALRNMDEQTHS